MASREAIDDQISRLHPRDVESYAESTGWQRVPSGRRPITIFRYPNSSTDEIVVPLDATYVDYRDRMRDAVEALSGMLKRSFMEVLTELLRPSDVIKFRVAAQETEDGGLPLSEGVSLYNGMKRALLATACDYIDPKPYHNRIAFGDAEKFVDSCRLGQTELGSYVASVICPLDPKLDFKEAKVQPPLFDVLPTHPFGRGVMHQMMTSLDHIQRFSEAEEYERLVEPKQNDMRISGNFFEALSEMRPPDGDSLLEISISWSPTNVPKWPTSVPANVTLPRMVFPHIEQIADRLRPTFHNREALIVGKVYALSGEPGDNDLMQGQVGIRFIEEDASTIIEARVSLRAEDYQKACDAHKLGKYVSLYGTLARRRRLYIIENYSEFDVMDYFTVGNEVDKKYAKRALQTAKRRAKTLGASPS